jgi:hypothetical protein
MALRHAAALALFAAFVQLAGTPAHAQSGTITTPPKIITPPAALPDLVIADMKTTPVCNANGTTTANVKVTVANLSPRATADLSKVTWQIVVAASWWAVNPETLLKSPPPAVVEPKAGGPMAFKPGQTWTTTLTVVGIPAMKKNVKTPGMHGIAVRVDPSNGVAESDEMNNHREDLFFDPCFYVK